MEKPQTSQKCNQTEQRVWMLYSAQPKDIHTPQKYKHDLIQRKQPATEQYRLQCTLTLQKAQQKHQNESNQIIQDYTNPQIGNVQFNFHEPFKYNSQEILTSRHQFISYFSVQDQDVQDVIQQISKKSQKSTQPKSIMEVPKRHYILNSKKKQKYDSKCQCSLM